MAKVVRQETSSGKFAGKQDILCFWIEVHVNGCVDDSLRNYLCISKQKMKHEIILVCNLSYISVQESVQLADRNLIQIILNKRDTNMAIKRIF
jgi:hypothetical protein